MTVNAVAAVEVTAEAEAANAETEANGEEAAATAVSEEKGGSEAEDQGPEEESGTSIASPEMTERKLQILFQFQVLVESTFMMRTG